MATGTSPGICTVESSESSPPWQSVGTGMPITGSVVCEATTPARWAAPPAPAPAAPAAAPAAAPVEAKPPAAAEPRPPAAEAKALAREGTFTIQVGSVRDAAEARRIVERYKSYRARIVTADIPGKGRWYRVRIGSFDNRAAAERYLKDVQRDEGAGGFVTPAN